MKKRFISLVAAAALVGGIAIASTPATSQAGTVTVKGDTQATLYGFTWAEYNWINQATGDADHSNMPIQDNDGYLYNKTQAKTSTGVTRIGFAFKNEDAGLTGRIEGGFFHAGNNYRLRRAYVQHNFDNFYVLVGQEWILEEPFASISAGFTAPAGFDEGILRVPQVRVGTKLDLGGANLDLALALEWEGSSAVSTAKKNHVGDEIAAASVDRVTFATTAARAVVHFDTGFGAPAKVYAWGAITPVYISSDNATVSNVTDNSQTSYAFGAGVKVPVSMIAVGANYQYSDGATNYAGLSNYQPASYYVKSNGDVKDTEMQAFNVNAVLSPMPCVSVGAEYDYVQFKNDDVFGGTKPKVDTYLGQVKFKTTKYTTLTVEWRHFKAKDFDVTGLAEDDSFSGDQIYARYMYVF